MDDTESARLATFIRHRLGLIEELDDVRELLPNAAEIYLWLKDFNRGARAVDE